ncbi:Eco57I restriction-modification methylase domain-containing protein [Ilumatobacter nonamiensis]|uniref:Eco57I restriction-modification methylase domain-containing protein n=1 Tax=Ilumatobacter nonamiensis TaxID=467093 RepID=UPI00058E1D74|nr:DNA methyltransferase [Ilumatobacter nonamiensis]
MSADAFVSVRVAGSALPADVLSAVLADADGLGGLRADDYRLELGVTPREAANRAWSVLTSAYAAYRRALADRPDGDPAVGLTREKWLAIVLRELDFGRVPATPAGGLVVDERQFPISHEYRTDAGLVPIHLLGWGVELDKRTPGQPGAADRAPHAMVQEYLNRTDEALWGVLSNGRRLRLLRDSSTLIGQSFVEFDLEAMFDGEVFSDFVVLYLLCHATRFDTRNPDGTSADDLTAADCWLERWRTHAADTGTRALTALRPAVAKAIEALGTGFARHPRNDLHRQLADRSLEPDDLHHSLLRLVYRLLFCFVAEDRELLLDPETDPAARERYHDWFSTARLRRVATRRHGSGHSDLWHSLRLVLDGLGSEGGRPELGIPGLGGIFELGKSDIVRDLELSNAALLEAVRHLTVVQPAGGGPKRRVDYRSLGAEELGSVYESLLEFMPRYDTSQRTFSLESVVGNERKTSGAYYTPTSLIDCLLDSALDPLLDDAEKAADPEQALLGLTVCDPACGSGHFLVAAAKRIAARLATVRARAEGAEEPTPLDEQAAMHDVVDHCIYGVDLNPLAAELAKVSLWLESVQPGRALSFLDAHIKVGNALLGATPTLLAAGVPDEAFAALDGDDKQVVSALKKRNKAERAGQDDLFSAAGVPVGNKKFADAAREIEALRALDLVSVHLAQRRQREFDSSTELGRARFLADAWCAAFMIPKSETDQAITDSTLRTWYQGDLPPSDHSLRRLVERTATEYRFFHWHLEFPQILTVDESIGGPGWSGGFSCVVGNPPWERTKLQDKEFFSAVGREDIAGAPNAARRQRLVEELRESAPALHERYTVARRGSEAVSHFFRKSGRFPLCGRGDVNTYPLFAEHGTSVTGSDGRFGIIAPTGLATDNNTQPFFRAVLDSGRLRVFYDFLNNDRLFYGVGNRTFKFCIMVLSGSGDLEIPADFGSFLAGPATLSEPGRRFTLTSAEIARINPNTKSAPLFRTRDDARILLGVHDRLPVLRLDAEPGLSGWDVRYQRHFEMSTDSGLFTTTSELLDSGAERVRPDRFRLGNVEYVPLLEGKMFNHFNPRWGDYAMRAEGVGDSELPRVDVSVLDNPAYANQPRYWVEAPEVEGRLRERWDRDWLIAFRDVARSYNERTVIPCMLPRYGVGHTGPLLQFGEPTVEDGLFLVAMLSSFATDWCLRLRQGGTHLTYGYFNQIPVVHRKRLGDPCPWSPGESVGRWFAVRAWELLYTTIQLDGAAKELGDASAPFRWDAGRRTVIRTELDAGFFLLYELSPPEVHRIMANFHVVQRKDDESHGRFRTLEVILGEYHAMQRAIETGVPYESPLDPPPGSGPRHDAG